MNKINVRPILKIVDIVVQPLGWLSLDTAHHINLRMACTKGDFKRIMNIHKKYPNGLSEEQKTEIFVKIGEDLAWVEKYNSNENFREHTLNQIEVQLGSYDNPHAIEKKLKSLYHQLYSEGLFPQTFVGQKMAVGALTVNYSVKLDPEVYVASPFEFLLENADWNNETRQWLAEDAVESAQSYNRLNDNPSELMRTLAGYSPFKRHQIGPFLDKYFSTINWMQTERQRGAGDISTLRPLWESALKSLPESFAIRLIHDFPAISQSLRFTTVLSERKNISVEMFDVVAAQQRMSLKRLTRKSRDPDGITTAVKNAQIQSYVKDYNKEHNYTKCLLAYLIHKETQQSRNNIMAAIGTQSTDQTPSSSATRKKM